ncbi:hypothetical protein D1B17_06565 [Companilactobacillus zhachilii]|uniref:MmcQ/YjbR family DNA-binding protein n=1 Tax=Companilactobacillus zhachilii TaxID=2304606 RepID=A0A386PUG5_9LACO|nr:MmcQ/YjbR family DNA-binding protein [Companilactobacillus zhachilii]AYE38313.1 hypothetical protein D1B17_06565 [Companilactobacillus zhachilii]
MAMVTFKNSKVNFGKLTKFGFIKHDNEYIYQVPIVNQQFQMTVVVNQKGQLDTKVVDVETKTEYVLHLQPNLTGKFVKRVANEYQAVLDEIKANCFDSDIFKTPQSKKVIAHVTSTFGDNLEFLWKNFPQYAIWRRNDTKKWYALLLNVPKSKLGLDSDEIVTVMDFHGQPDEIVKLVDNQKYFTGYHMNKHSWYTIILDGSVNNQEIFERLQVSYGLAK